ncbi:ScyD/ScyE family protein [Nocardioides sp. GCM10027113]|uniref:ScyD/ScyE family protein n=1 Tax=unclassified Nocardioides TaxID=2615069 RepID=UPI003619BA6B
MSPGKLPARTARRTLVPAAIAALALVGGLSAPAKAGVAEEPVVGGLITPLSLAIAPDGTVYVAQNFAGMLTRATPGAEPEVVYTAAEGTEVGAVSVSGGEVTFATSFMGRPQDTRLMRLGEGGSATEVADLWAFEKASNPDGGIRYGIVRLSESCKDRFGKGESWMLPYRGIKESHPYASTTVAGTTYVADAAANAVLEVSATGEVATTAVLPATRVEITRKIRKALELPRCAQGKTYKLEAVPTDVEEGPDGNLYVTTLPGGPEIPQMGRNGAVYRIDVGTGSVRRVAGGLVTPTGLAIGPDGTSYVSMLFASTILEQPLLGEPGTLAEVPLPGDVEYHDGRVYATVTDLMSDGSQPPSGEVRSWTVGVD